ncbi:MAG: alpha/beta fold hydrolase [Elusimicrobia bacterium]|nr:alpha/beta fold hydrolase [Elusimicrobiota bacterium]
MKPLFALVFFQFLFLASGINAQAGLTTEKISFYTRDGLKIVGVYKPPKENNGEVFVLLHGLGSNKEEWNYFETILAESGYGFLAYDARGHGESSTKKDGTIIDYKNFGKPTPKSQWGKMIVDLANVVNYLITEKKISRKNIGLIGASIGANISLIYGSSYNHVGTLVLLSPGLEYIGFDTLDYINAYKKGKIAICASPQDEYSYKSSLILYKKIMKNKQALLIEGESGHGVKLFDGEFDNLLMEWMKKQ